MGPGQHRETPSAIARFSRPPGDGREMLVLIDYDAGGTGSTDFVRLIASGTLVGNIGIDGVLHFSGASLSGPLGVKTHSTVGNYTVSNNDCAVGVDATTGNRTITLPSAPFDGQMIWVGKVDVTANTVTVQPNSGQTLFGGNPTFGAGSKQFCYIQSLAGWMY